MRHGLPSGLLALAVIGLVLIGVVLESFLALAVVLIEGVAAAAVLGSAALAGGWLLRPLGLHHRPWAERWVFGAGLGIGGVALLVLLLGWAGWWSRGLALVLAIYLAGAGMVRLGLDLRRRWEQRPSAAAMVSGGICGFHWLWLLAVPFAVVTLLSASLPPGVLWREEGFGYDILEYHLAAPKAWLEAGQITFLPHNVYTNFPLNGEMIWLWMLALHGDAIGGMFLAQMANVGLGVLAVAGAWVVGRSFSPMGGVLAGVLAAVTPWLAYLSGIAYVEPGMLAMGLLSLGAVLRGAGWDDAGRRMAEAQAAVDAGAVDTGPDAWARSESRHGRRARWFLLAGLLAGLACGFKYTALPMLAVPTGLLVLFAVRPGSWRLRAVGVFAAGCLLTFSPWLMRNLVNTGNPVFPLGYSVFGAGAEVWDAELDGRWQRAHGSADAEHADSSWMRRAIDRTANEPRMGWMLWVLAGWGALRRRDRLTAGLLAMLTAQVGVWLAATHLFARFAVVFCVPLWALAGRGWRADAGRAERGGMALVLAIAAGLNLYHHGGLYYDHTRLLTEQGERIPLNAYSQVGAFTEGQWPGTDYIPAINGLPASARVMLVGEARTFYLRRPCVYATAFNHHPLGRAALRIADDAALVQWLSEQRVTHVLAHWAEMARLRSTYGLDAGLNEGLFPRLEAGGVEAVSSFGDPAAPYATLYEVPQR